MVGTSGQVSGWTGLSGDAIGGCFECPAVRWGGPEQGRDDGKAGAALKPSDREGRLRTS